VLVETELLGQFVIDADEGFKDRPTRDGQLLMDVDISGVSLANTQVLSLDAL
jgi:hypothetical protein